MLHNVFSKKSIVVPEVKKLYCMFIFVILIVIRVVPRAAVPFYRTVPNNQSGI